MKEIPLKGALNIFQNKYPFVKDFLFLSFLFIHLILLSTAMEKGKNQGAYREHALCKLLFSLEEPLSPSYTIIKVPSPSHSQHMPTACTQPHATYLDSNQDAFLGDLKSCGKHCL